MRSSIGRCRASGNACRVSVSIKCTEESRPLPSVQISISDTGVGSNLEEFQDMANYCLRDTVKWDGVLYVTTTCIADKDIYQYRFHMNGTSSAERLTRLLSKPKHGNRFSGTQVSFSVEIEESTNNFLAWMIGYIRRILILKVPMIAFELRVEHANATGSVTDCDLQSADGVLLPTTISSIERITSGLQEYVLKHGNVLDKECPSCLINRDHLKVGNGFASNAGNRKGSGQTIEVAIAIVDAIEISDSSCSWLNSAVTEVLFFQDFLPGSITESTFNALKGINWLDYGLCLKTGAFDGNGYATLEWENLAPCIRIDITCHCYNKQQVRQQTPPDKVLLKKAVKLALDDLKTKYAGILLSHHASKIRSHVPNLSRSIAGLIMSSNDDHFQGECASLLGLQPLDVKVDGRIESCICNKIIRIIEMNDKVVKRNKQRSTFLFECEGTEEENYSEGEEPEEEDRGYDLEL